MTSFGARASTSSAFHSPTKTKRGIRPSSPGKNSPSGSITSPTSVVGFSGAVHHDFGIDFSHELFDVPFINDTSGHVKQETPSTEILPTLPIPPTRREEEEDDQKKCCLNDSSSSINSNGIKRFDRDIVTNLHLYLARSDWKKLKRALANLQLNASLRVIREAFTVKNDDGESILHVAAYKAPTKQVLTMLDLIPLRHRKEFLHVVDHEGNTPLHLACANLDERVNMTIIKNVLLLSPEVIEVKNANGDTPLHLLFESPAFKRTTDFDAEVAAEEAIASLLLMLPSTTVAVTSQDNAGATSLHVAIASGTYERVITKLLKLAPKAVRIPDKHGLLPIHFVAAFGQCPWPIASEMIRLYPLSIYCQTNTGDTPLHLLMSNSQKFLKKDDYLDRNTTKIAELLLGEETCLFPGKQEQVSPVLVRNTEDLNPLHAAALFNTPVQLTRILMQSLAAQRAASETTACGSTALHLACTSKGISKRAANVITFTTREACSTTDQDGRTPLALVTKKKKVNTKIVKNLTEACPEAAAITAKRGKLPLHLAVSSRKAKVSVVKALIKAYPEGVEAVTDKGNTPLHEACKSRAPKAVVELLIDKYPRALSLQNQHHEIPADRARAHGASNETLTFLRAASYLEEQMSVAEP